MAVPHTESPMTRSQFYALDRSDGVYRYTELIDGALVFMFGRREDGRFVNSPSIQHQLVATELAADLVAWRRGGPDRGLVLSGTDVEVPNVTHDVHAPDIAWWPAARVVREDGRWRFTGAPALVVEVLSPSTRHRDEGVKRFGYQMLGVEELWRVDPYAGSTRVLRRVGGALTDVARLDAGQALTSPLLPGFAATLDRSLER
jgi:Uma2 family endonuclease